MRRVVDDAFVRAALDHLETVPGDALRTGPIEGFFADACDRLTMVAQDLLGAGVEPFGATYVVKPARTGLPSLWHQDGHPWAARGITDAVTIGVALDPTDDDNGCLRVIPGSHALAAQPLRPAADPPNVFSAEIDPALVDESLAVSVPLAVGDCSAHLPTLIHGSGPNRSGRPRRTLVLRYRMRATR